MGPTFVDHTAVEPGDIIRDASGTFWQRTKLGWAVMVPTQAQPDLTQPLESVFAAGKRVCCSAAHPTPPPLPGPAAGAIEHNHVIGTTDDGDPADQAPTHT